MAQAYRTVRLEAVAPAPWKEGDPEWRPVRHQLGVRAFGVNVWGGREAGDPVIDDHDEASVSGADHEELYYVIRGHATFTIGGDEVDAPAGTFVFVPDGATRRSGVAREPGTTLLVVGSNRDGGYSVPEWEGRNLGSA